MNAVYPRDASADLSRDALYVNGEWRQPHGKGRLEVEDPATEAVIATVPMADEEDVQAAVSAAYGAFPRWSGTPAVERAEYLAAMLSALQSRADVIAETITAELGSPIGFSRAVQAGVPLMVLEDYVALCRQPLLPERVGNSLVVREAAGVVAAITPWNYPLYQVMLKVAAALAAGCTVVLKPAALTPLAAYLLLDAADEAALPPGVLNLVVGSGSVVGEVLAADPRVDVVSFTGSTEVGRRIMSLASERIARVSLELGGKSACIVLDDADVERAVTANLQSLLSNAGQTCSAWSRLIVQRSRYSDVMDSLLEQLPTYTPGDPWSPATSMGPLASQRQASSVQSFIHDATSVGATRHTLTGYETPAMGHFVPPSVFTDVAADSALAREEVFGPVLAVFAVDGVEEAIDLANDSAYGLSGAVWAGDLERAVDVAKRVRTGQLEVNGGPFNIQAPFGGYKQSGLGRELGKWGLEEFMETKSIQLPLEQA
jgi:aldehyde dehydrogenase (NAD+)